MLWLLGVVLALIVLRTVKQVLLRLALTACVGVLAYYAYASQRDRVLRAHLVDTGGANEVVVLEGRVAGRNAFFQIDTGYAGPPVLSTTYLALDAATRRAVDERGRSVRERYAETVRRVQAVPDDATRARAIEDFLATSGCYAYTSGCTMRLMGIGSVVEQQADMFLCDAIVFANASGARVSPKHALDSGRGDVVVTNPLPASVHILTCDYLLQLTPCVLRLAAGRVEFRMDAMRYAQLAPSFAFAPLRTAGGAPVVTVTVGGEAFECTLDTGAPGPVCLGAQAAARLRACRRRARSVRQRGVNGENICSTVVSADVAVLGVHLPDATVFVNDAAVDHTDGYVGMGVLRALDVMFASSKLGVRKNGARVRAWDEYPASVGECANGAPVCDAEG